MKLLLFFDKLINWFKQLPAKRRVQIALVGVIVVALILTYQLYRHYLESKANSDTIEAITYVSGSYCLLGDTSCNPDASIYSGLALSQPVTLTLEAGDRPTLPVAQIIPSPNPIDPPAATTTYQNTKPTPTTDTIKPPAVVTPQAVPSEVPLAVPSEIPQVATEKPNNQAVKQSGETVANQPKKSVVTTKKTDKPTAKTRPSIIKRTIAFLTGQPKTPPEPTASLNSQTSKPTSQPAGWSLFNQPETIDQNSPQANSAHTAGQRAKKLAKLDKAKKLLYAILLLDLALLGLMIFHTIRTRND